MQIDAAPDDSAVLAEWVRYQNCDTSVRAIIGDCGGELSAPAAIVRLAELLHIASQGREVVPPTASPTTSPQHSTPPTMNTDLTSAR